MVILINNGEFKISNGISIAKIIVDGDELKLQSGEH